MSRLWNRFSSSKPSTPKDNSNLSRQSRITLSGNKSKQSSVSLPSHLLTNRSNLTEYLKKQSPDDYNEENILSLAKLCLNDAEENSLQGQNMELEYIAALLMEWIQFRGEELTPIYLRKLAKAHYHSWVTRGVIGEVCLFDF